MNSLLLSVVNRNMYVETEPKMTKERLEHFEVVQQKTFGSVNEIAESVAAGTQKRRT